MLKFSDENPGKHKNDIIVPRARHPTGTVHRAKSPVEGPDSAAHKWTARSFSTQSSMTASPSSPPLKLASDRDSSVDSFIRPRTSSLDGKEGPMASPAVSELYQKDSDGEASPIQKPRAVRRSVADSQSGLFEPAPKPSPRMVALSPSLTIRSMNRSSHDSNPGSPRKKSPLAARREYDDADENPSPPSAELKSAWTPHTVYRSKEDIASDLFEPTPRMIRKLK